MKNTTRLAALFWAILALQPAFAQFTILDQAQDAVTAPPVQATETAPVPSPSLCGSEPIGIARMNWPSAALLAEIHARVLVAGFGCETRVVPGDLSATASSMASSGQPAVAPEMWLARIAELWNRAIEAQMVRAAAPSFSQSSLEGWFMPAYIAGAFTATPAASALATALPELSPSNPVRFISCPSDWACAVINRNLIRAHGLTDMVAVVEPANRFEMDTLIAEAVSRREFFLFYYWQPNAVLAQLDFAALDMGTFDAEAMECLASRACPNPTASAFVSEQVVMALAERVFSDTPVIAGYFQRATMPVAEMNRLLAQVNEPGATVEAVAERFMTEREDLWRDWVGNGAP